MLDYSPKIIALCDEAEIKEWTGLKSDRSDWVSTLVTLGK